MYLEQKRCTLCDRVLPLSDFRHDKNKQDGHKNQCRECVCKQETHYRQGEKYEQRQRKNREAIKNDPQRLARRREHARKYNKAHPHNYKKIMYSLSESAYLAMLQSQDYRCAICRRPETSKHNNGQIRSLAIDHDHGTGKVRGLLCFKCNTQLATLENEIFVFAALAYLGSQGTNDEEEEA